MPKLKEDESTKNVNLSLIDIEFAKINSNDFLAVSYRNIDNNNEFVKLYSFNFNNNILNASNTASEWPIDKKYSTW